MKVFKGISGFILFLLLISAFNFWQMREFMGVDDMHYEAPMGLIPRFFILICLIVACFGSFKNQTLGRIISLVGTVGAISFYLYWWFSSYQAFKIYSGYRMDFLNSPEFSQVAYLNNGNWLDVFLIIALFTVFILQIEKLITTE
jgi:hypothetical protein